MKEDPPVLRTCDVSEDGCEFAPGWKNRDGFFRTSETRRCMCGCHKILPRGTTICRDWDAHCTKCIDKK